ncbi:hypothetical protein L2E82_13061 [Cichorium intybus]|uniref:Uncharacterized protein n=1 Tax=Cichorium intybus TaxID=13427 RepID=A0ACB9GHS6_CICIN|nr:hypothetical protein L2E82_13061 [Cichorium intybus]
MLKTSFHLYPKGKGMRVNGFDLLGDGIFNIDGDGWKFQRQVSSHEFNTRSLRKFVEHVVDVELTDRLVPILASSAATRTTVLDFQDILQRFAFDNICKIAFGYDPAYLMPSLPEAIFATAFEEAVFITTGRIRTNLPMIWKLKRLLNIGSEKRLRIAVGVVREFANKVTKEKKLELEQKSSLDSVDLLSRFLSSGHSDEKFVADIAGPRVCLGKEMAFLQMKRVVAGVLRRFRVVPAADDLVDPVYVSSFTAKMKGGFPVRIEVRNEIK